MISEVNVSDTERLTTALGGAALAVFGIKQRSLLGTVLAAGGGALLVRASVGRTTTSRSYDTRTALGGTRGINVDESVTIRRRHDELYRIWRDLENLPRFMEHIISVGQLDARRSQWLAKA